MDMILPCSSICFQPLLSLPLLHNPKASPKGNHEDKDNKRIIDIPSTTSAIERRMLEYMATRTQTLQAMTQTMVNIHQYNIEQASNLKNPNLVLGDIRQIPFVSLSLDKAISHASSSLTKTEADQHVTPHNTEITKTGVPARPVMKQVLEAWNHQNNKRSHRAPELRTNEQ
jgi:hypothetical protein